MGFFKRAAKSGQVDTPINTPIGTPIAAVDPADVGVLMLQGAEMLPRLVEAHMRWGLGSADRWDLDQTTGVITWTFPDKVASAPAQILGSYSTSSGSWMWAWANPSIRPAMSRDSARLRDWGERSGYHAFTKGEFEVDTASADSLIALAMRLTEAGGYYRGPAGTAFVIITFGTVTLTPTHGKASTVEVTADQEPPHHPCG